MLTSKTIKVIAKGFPNQLYAIAASYDGQQHLCQYDSSSYSITTFIDIATGEKLHIMKGQMLFVQLASEQKVVGYTTSGKLIRNAGNLTDEGELYRYSNEVQSYNLQDHKDAAKVFNVLFDIYSYRRKNHYRMLADYHMSQYSNHPFSV